ncbi:hypothetical protein [Nakamurella deserti]|uniref:hypothetical protein n=1 Tax=Nakamurella deserti TaxID=2164074 RepID=UPI000DBE73A8|nr:hypothetical protein [Nakamurella deserti]
MTAATAAVGLSGFVFLSVVGHGPPDPAVAAALSSVYLLSNILGPGVFVAVEQETSRRVSGAAGASAAGTGRAAAAVAALTTAVLVAAGLPLTGPVLGGDRGLLFALLCCVAGSAAVFHTRGVLGGQRRFRRYATGLLVDAAVRIVGVLLLAGLGVTSGVAYALALCAAPGVAALLTRPRAAPARGPGDGSTVGGGIGRAVALLLVAALLAMTVANLAPVLVTAALPADPARAFGFACALVLTRAPLLLVGPLQAMLLPGLAAAAARGETAVVRRRLHRGLRWTAGLGVLAVAGAAVLGRPVLGLLFGPDADVMPAATVALLTASAVLMTAVALVQPVLVALGGHRALVLGWVCGALVFAAAFGVSGAVGGDPVTAAVTATLAAPVVTLTVQLAAVRRLH